MPAAGGGSGRNFGNTSWARSAAGNQPCATMPSSTKFQRSLDLSGFLAGSHRDGDWIVPASIAPSATDRSLTSLPK